MKIFKQKIKSLFRAIFSTKSKISNETVRQAIVDYKKDGIDLMTKLGEKYRLDINKPEEYEKLISRQNKTIKRKGSLSKKWNYRFHGTACEFYNKNNQQSVEVVLSNSPEFGEIDAWFLMSYMQSTKKYKKHVSNIEWLDLKKIIKKITTNL